MAAADAELADEGEPYVRPDDLAVPEGAIPLPPPRPFL